jgi:putative addiction module killer protein
MHYITFETEEYSDWLASQTLKSRRQIQDRLSKIEDEGYFGHNKYLEDEDLWELKFNDGRRIYYVIVKETNVILLLGGNKNGQDKDIKKASKILRQISER